MHLYAGQEAVAVGCLRAPDRRATTWSALTAATVTALLRAAICRAMMKEIYGRRDGLCKGKGGSMHIADLRQGHARRQRDRRRRPAACRSAPRIACRSCAATGTVSVSPSAVTAAATRARCSRAMNMAVVLQGAGDLRVRGQRLQRAHRRRLRGGLEGHSPHAHAPSACPPRRSTAATSSRCTRVCRGACSKDARAGGGPAADRSNHHALLRALRRRPAVATARRTRSQRQRETMDCLKPLSGTAWKPEAGWL